MNKVRLFTFILLNLLVLNLSVLGQRPETFSKEKPLRLDFDMENIKQPKSIETGYLYDFIDGTLFQSVRKGVDIPRHIRKIRGKKKESINVNTWDEVPNSSWFTNRMGFREMTVEEIQRGPNINPPPKKGKLMILRGKNIGATPGFWVRDENNQIFILKFDPPKFPELASGAEMIATKMFYAFGYNVPENHIFRFDREDLEIAEDAKFTNSDNKKVKMTEKDLNLILSRVARQKDGQYRSLASRLIEGKPLGGFTFSGKRKDDANDIIPHELRRDVRALKLFSAWTEHNDVRVGNTLDVFVEEDNRKFVRHYLIDFGSTYGSDTIQPNEEEVGHEYRLDFNQAAKILASGGIYQPRHRGKNYDPIFSPAVGRYSEKGFHPKKWKSNFPLVAFGEMTKSDAFWAMRIIVSFTPEQIRTVVKTAEFSNQADTDYLTDKIIARQKRITKYFSTNKVGLGKFALKQNNNVFQINFLDYRRRFTTDESPIWQYEYEIHSLGKKSKLLSKGIVKKEQIEIDSKLLRQITKLGNSEKNQGIAKLVIKRPKEKRKSTIYLWAKDKNQLQIAGIIH